MIGIKQRIRKNHLPIPPRIRKSHLKNHIPKPAELHLRLRRRRNCFSQLLNTKLGMHKRPYRIHAALPLKRPFIL